MAAPDGKLGDPLASREVAVKKMLSAIGRETSDLTFTPAPVDDSAALPDDPDVHFAWEALAEKVADVASQFKLFNTFRVEIEPNVNGRYLIPAAPGAEPWDPDVFSATGGGSDLIAAVRVIQQPPDLNLVWRGTRSTITTSLVDTITGLDYGFTGKGTVICEVAYWAPWEHIPYPMRRYAHVAATRVFIQRAIGATEVLGYTERDEQMALARAQQYDLEQSPANFFFGSGGGEREPGAAHSIKDRWPF